MNSSIQITPNKILITIGTILTLSIVVPIIISMIVYPVFWRLSGYLLLTTIGLSSSISIYHKFVMLKIERNRAKMLNFPNSHNVIDVNSGSVIVKAHGLNGKQQNEIIEGNYQPVKQIKNVLSLTKTAYHFLLVGDTGSGKSTLARAIINEVNADTLVLDPHATFNEWPNQVRIIQDYNSIGIALERIVKLMDNRYLTGDNGKTILVAIDETPAVIDELKELGYDPGRMIRRLSREGRKANIILILMSQGENVGDLGQKGYSSVKFNFVKILLNRPDTLQGKCKVEFANGDNQLYTLPNPTLQSPNSVKPKTLQLSSGVKSVKCANPNCDNTVKPGSLYCKENYNACKQAVYRLNNEL